jgi:MOSC domain-containing protein YiiM
MLLLAINIGLVAPLFVNESGNKQSVITGIRKQAIQGSIVVNKLGLAGDEQADLTVHGGLDKALYAYPYEHYAFWYQERVRMLKQESVLETGLVGENLTTQGLFERDLWVGDQLRLGSVVLEVTEPRAPCFKFSALMGYSKAAKHMLQSGYTGVYLKVVETGEIQAEQPITLIPGVREMSIAEINDRRLKGRQRDLF